MKKRQELQTNTTAILSVSPNPEDHSTLEAIIGNSPWALLKANNLFTARALLLQEQNISVVFCERNLMSGTWIDIVKHVQPLPNPPAVIVTSRLADDRLWSEVLNRGGWDLLAKPFDHAEVLRSVRSAWQHCQNETQLSATKPKVMVAAG
jgi:DNA-binding NtrC family response regulator